MCCSGPCSTHSSRFDLNQHFYDFTAVLIALFVLFLPERSIEMISEQMAEIRRRKIGPCKLLVGMIGVLVLLPCSR